MKKIPVVMQMEALECGAACLTMILAYYGKWIPLEEVRRDSGVSRNGVNAQNILRAAQNYGLEARGFHYETIDELKNGGEFPCIIHWNFNHFVVLNGFQKNKAVINDPARGRVKISMEEFNKSFTGVCLTFKPGKNFEKGGRRKSTLAFARKRLKGAKSSIIFIAIASVISSLFSIINPMMSRIFMDKILTQNEFLYPFVILLSCFGILQLAAMFTHSLASLKINGKMSVAGSASYMWKVLRLPMEFFGQRMAGDIQMRQAANASVAETLVNTFAPLVINGAMMIFYLAVMLRYSVLLSAVGLLAISLNAFVSVLISEERVNAAGVHVMNEGKFYSSTISGIKMIDTIKASGAEDEFFRKWTNLQTAVNNSSVELINLAAYLGKLPEIILLLSNTAVLGLGIFMTMRGNFTLGMIMTFQGIMAAFAEPARVIIEAGQTLQEMRTDMERIEDVMEYPSDSNCEDTREEKNINYEKLSGNIEIKNLTFGYSKFDEPIIKNFSMTLKQGASVAFVGHSGCGKSTLAKLISGLYPQWEGEILFDGKKISEIDRNIFTGSVAVVEQDITIFEDTIAANIKMWDDSIEDFEMILAARDAQLHNDIMTREGGYNSRLTEGGRNFSGGQCQRLEIARVLAQDPTIIILDEATSALDAKTEFEVVKAIKARGITCIVIAHRLSTIRDCDEIIVLEKGEIAERGTHDELFAKNGKYTQLVTSG